MPRSADALASEVCDAAPGELLPAPLRPRQHPRFNAQQAELRTRRARGDREAGKLADAISVAIAAISENPCLGYRMRGPSIVEGLCSYHLPKPFKRWRVIYRYSPSQDGPVFLVLGEHWRSVGGGRGRGGSSSLGSRLRFEDVYEAVDAVHGPTSKVDLKRTRKAVREQEKERCCRRS